MTRGCTEAWEARPDRAHWLDLCLLPKGALVEFVDDWDCFPDGIVPRGTLAHVEENGLNEIWATMMVRPATPLGFLAPWEGLIYLTLRYDDLAECDEFAPAPVKIIKGGKE